jgi:hypothetical protein
LDANDHPLDGEVGGVEDALKGEVLVAVKEDEAMGASRGVEPPKMLGIKMRPLLKVR